MEGNMGSEFKSMKAADISGNVFHMIGKEWVLISAGTIDSYNMMTASWGTMGVLWNKEIFMCFIRPGRYTFEFMEKQKYFTANFLPETYRDKLDYCGSHSGRQVDKMKETGLTPVKSGSGAVFFEEAGLVLECKKIYYQDLDPINFLDKSIEGNYPMKDYHRIYIGEIINCMKK
jgi:flavin reductase (DIM6/NTAB) family NADH-FMN oxidoreductase RutF